MLPPAHLLPPAPSQRPQPSTPSGPLPTGVSERAITRQRAGAIWGGGIRPYLASLRRRWMSGSIWAVGRRGL